MLRMYAKTIFGILCVFLFVVPQFIYAGAADLDLTFDNDGKVTTDFVGGSDLGRGVVIQGDGKIIVAGRMLSISNGNDFAVARYNVDGSLDLTFGSGGRVNTDFNFDDDEAFAVALQADGKIVVAGSSFNGGSSTDFALVRYSSDGNLDVTFGTNGKVTTDFAGDSDEARALVVQSDGKIVAVGSMFSSTDRSDFALARYNSNGSLDSSFGFGGKVNTDLISGDDDEAYGVALQTDGKILAVGKKIGSDTDIGLTRYNQDGSLDDTFNNDGIKITDITGQDDEGFGVALQSDGKIVVVGGTDSGGTYDFVTIRYNDDASLDATFSFDGIVITDFASDFDEAVGVAIQPDGKIIVGGVSSVGNAGNFAIARYDSDGNLDGTFDFDGKVTTDFGGNEAVLAVELQSDGKILAAGYSFSAAQNISDFAVARYEGDPAPQCLFCDDFQDGVLAPDWAYIKPTWSEANGNLIGTPLTRKAEVTANPAFGGCIQCTINASMSTAGGPSNKVWLLGWYQDKKNGVEILMKEENDKWVLKQRSGGKVVTKVSAASIIQPNVFYGVEVSYDGTNFTLKVDGVTLATTTAGDFPIGTIGFRVKSTVGSFASISVN
jgi:uncharacterized delta-60 repeat protein